MSAILSPALQKQLARQLRFLASSARLFDEGDRDEAIRIAVTIRILVHDTRMSTSLLHLAGKKNIRLLTSCPFQPSEMFLTLNAATKNWPLGPQDHCSLVIAKPDEQETFSIQPSLGVKEHCELIKVEEWWNQAVVFLWREETTLSRRDIVLAAANKDGGAHVDLALPRNYLRFSADEVVGIRPAAASDDHRLGYQVVPAKSEGLHFSCLRQMAYELLLSQELANLCGRSIPEHLVPMIWPSYYSDWSPEE